MNEAEIYRTLLREDYAEYVKHVHNGEWIKTRFHAFLCKYVQNFVERETKAPYEILVIHTPPQHGKLIADEEVVLTRNGWKQHGDLVVGDEVVGLNGEWVKVTHVFEKHVADREITFTNGETIKCHHKHEWVVYDRVVKRERTRETEYIEKRVSYGSQERKRGHRYNFMLPHVKPLIGENKALHVDPYVMGAWLGDGTNTKGCICSSEKDLVVLKECESKYEVTSRHVHKDTGVITSYYKDLPKKLRQYGLCQQERVEKHIPQEYLTASKQQRLELLAGLIDTDGYVDQKHRRIVFTTAEEKLRDSFEQLVSTFGWRTTTCRVEPTVSTSGIVGKRPYWAIGFNPTEEIPCRIARKQLKEFSKQRRIAISGVKEIEPVQGNCITVEGGIYLVGKKMVPTHNSQTITETLPSWYIGKHPNKRVIEISYNKEFAIRFGRRNKRKIVEYGKEIFGIEVSKEASKTQEFEIANHSGGMLSAGIGTAVTGQRANLLIIDDPVKNRAEANSKSRRDLIYDEWLSTFRSRLAPHSKVILIMTRWHEDDLAGRLLDEEDNIKYLRFPCECEDEKDLLHRKIGDSLCPDIGKDRAWLEATKATMLSESGTMTWNALYQGRPTAKEGNIIERDWWQYYEGTPEVVDYVMSVDATFKDSEQSDFVAIQVWGKTGANLYLIDAVKKRLNFPDTIVEIRRLRATYPQCVTTLIEDKANGSAIITMLRKELFGIIAVEPNGSKMSRVQAILGAIESGNVYLPKDKRFTTDFVEECSSFPNGAHDDQVDCMSQALNRLIYQRSEKKVKRKKSVMELMFPAYYANMGHDKGRIKPI